MAVLQQVWFALLESLSESAPFVVVGLLLAGMMREFVPSSALQQRLGGNGMGPILRAVGIGSLLPICSCSTIPLGLGMSRSGARSGTVLAFMTSAPALSPVTILLGFSLLGPQLLGAYAFSVVSGSCLLGMLGNRLLRERQSSAAAHVCSGGCCGGKQTRGHRTVAAVRWGLFDLGREVSQSLLFGLFLAAILLVFLPEELVLGWIGSAGPIAIVSVILLALPAYTCSVPALIVAASLIAKGANPGVAIAFLIAGPATNLGELNAIRVGLGSWTSAYYFVAVLVLAVTSALAIGPFDWAVPSIERSEVMTRVEHHHAHAHPPPSGVAASNAAVLSIPMWRWPFVVLIGGLAVYGSTKPLFTRLVPNSSWVARRRGEIEANTVAMEGLPMGEGGSP